MIKKINWNNYSLFEVSPLDRSSYLIKIDNCVQSDLKFYTCYTDINIDLVAYNLYNKKNIIGYVINIKDCSKFKILFRKYYIQVLNNSTSSYTNPQLVYFTKKVHLYKFNDVNNKEVNGYWFTGRLPMHWETAQ